MTSTATTSTNTSNASDVEELFALVPFIAGLDADNDASACDALTTNDPEAVACGVCRECLAARESLDDGRDEAFTRADVAPELHPLDVDDGDAIVPGIGGVRCPAGCYAGFVADPHGPSKHNPTGLRDCPVCG